MFGESDELAAIVCASRVGTTTGEVVVHVWGGDEGGVGEEDLGVGHGLMREEDDEWGAFLVQDGA